MLPYLLWPAVFACFFQGSVAVADFTLPAVLHRLYAALTGHNELWFLIVFWSLSIIGYVVTASGNLVKRPGLLPEAVVLGTLIAAAAALHKFYPNYLLWKQIVTYSPFFFLGVYVSRYEVLQRIASSKTASAAGWIVLFIAASQFRGDNLVYRLVGGIAAIPAFFYAARNVALPRICKNYLLTLGRYSLAIYIVHYFFVSVSAGTGIQPFLTGLSQWWLTFTATLFSAFIAGCCVLFAKFIATIPPLDLLLFGRGKR